MMLKPPCPLASWLLLPLAIVACSCASQAGVLHPAPALALTELPSLAALDTLRGTAAVANWPARTLEPLSTVQTMPLGAGLVLEAPAKGIAFAIYRIAEPAGTLQQVQLSGAGTLWLVIADYADGRWEQAALLASGAATASFDGISNPVSPGGYIYCAAVCAQNTSGVLDSVQLTAQHPDNGGTYFVTVGGSDSGPGTVSLPWATLQHAADMVSPGDTVHVLAGDYAGFHLQTSGEPGAPIRFLAEAGVTINADNPNTPDGINIEDWSGTGIGYIEIDGFTSSNRSRAGIRVVGSDVSPAHHITVRNCTCANNGTWGIFTGFVDDMLIEDNTCSGSVDEHGIYFSNSGDYVTIRHNTSFSNNGCGIHMNGDASMGGDGCISGALVENNTIYGNGAAGGSGINGDGVQHSTIRNNLLYGNHASGISLYRSDAAEGAHDNAVLNNTVVMAADSRWCLNISGESTGTTVFNNVFYNLHAWHGAITIEPAALTGFSADYNAVIDRFTTDDGGSVLSLAEWRTATGQDAHSFTAGLAELFTDAAGGDYTPVAASPLLGSGFALYAPAFDLGGAARLRAAGIDIGAIEVP